MLGTWKFAGTPHTSQTIDTNTFQGRGSGSLFFHPSDGVTSLHHTYRSTEYMAQFGASSCICDQQRTHISHRESYHWSPASCRLPEWDAVEFCRLLGRRKILFIGDSTMMQAASTVMSMTTAAGGHCADQLAYYRNDFLWHRHRDASETIGTGLSFKEAGGDMRLSHWNSL